MEAQVQVSSVKEKLILPNIVNTTRLLILRHVLNESEKGGTYPARIARELRISKAWVSRCLTELESQGVVESTSTKKACSFCNGTGSLVVENKNSECVFCIEGIMKIKSYPLFYCVPKEQMQKVRSLVYACVDMVW